ncbi:uncharacterized protein RCO7_04151 [Rhynchosporium graminicola]|uniref:methionyl-tRNA formyltransferase n=1 Tax=Rhynchosporium graminicola TaxID=2792576 RepID=A0A1E1KKF8_9HELO|nr:uncharacterized protein RCO7_04151 [Rhynchosporium commune]
MISLFLSRPLARKVNISRFGVYQNRFRSANKKTCKPLRILFCGSDEFSIASLDKLYLKHTREPEFIKSIDVLCRPGKPTGRSLKTIRDVPIKAFAQKRGLTVHEIDTFTGWELPRPDNESINLIVAVSFGRFVPPRILNAVEYGGLNVHPSLLPDYRGSAPLQRMLIKDEGMCGVTLQTLDSKTFDHGLILGQKELPYEPGTMTFQTLLDKVTPEATKLLIHGIKRRCFMPPLIELRTPRSKEYDLDPDRLNHASKITPADKRIYWQIKSADEDLPKRHRALGRLWTRALVSPTKSKRLIFHDIEGIRRPDALIESSEKAQSRGEDRLLENHREKTVHFFVEDQELHDPILYCEDGQAVIFRTPRRAIRVKRITVEGGKEMDASKAMKSLKSDESWTLIRRVDRMRRRTRLFDAVPNASDADSAHLEPGNADSKGDSVEELPESEAETKPDVAKLVDQATGVEDAQLAQDAEIQVSPALVPFRPKLSAISRDKY